MEVFVEWKPASQKLKENVKLGAGFRSAPGFGWSHLSVSRSVGVVFSGLRRVSCAPHDSRLSRSDCG